MRGVRDVRAKAAPLVEEKDRAGLWEVGGRLD